MLVLQLRPITQSSNLPALTPSAPEKAQQSELAEVALVLPEACSTSDVQAFHPLQAYALFFDLGSLFISLRDLRPQMLGVLDALEA